MTAHPIAAVLPDGTAPSKSALRAYVEARTPLVLALASEIQAIDMGLTVVAMLASTGAAYYYDAADTTSAHNGLTVLVDIAGRRFKAVSPSPARAGVYTGLSGVGTMTPPGSPSEGQAYIVGAAPSGAWAAHASEVAIWARGQWWFDVPAGGALAYYGGQLYVFSGAAWAAYP